jgi:hypothetical protein
MLSSLKKQRTASVPRNLEAAFARLAANGKAS